MGGTRRRIVGQLRFSSVVTKQSIHSVSRPNSNHSSSLSAGSSTSTSANEAANYETKRCAPPALEPNVKEKFADLVVFRLHRK